MNNIEELREVTEKALYGLSADDSLKQRILQKASGYSEDIHNRKFHTVPVFCTVLAALVLSLVLLNGLTPVNPASPGEINVFAAGNENVSSSENVQNKTILHEVDAHSVVSLELSGFGLINDPNLCSDLIGTLQSRAEKAEDGRGTNQGNLIITLSDGTVLCVAAEEPFIFSEVYWFCPEFFIQFREDIGAQNP